MADEKGAPAGFPGPVFPNPSGVRPKLDTEPTDTDSPVGAKFDTSLSTHGQPMDLHNPQAAEFGPKRHPLTKHFDKKNFKITEN